MLLYTNIKTHLNNANIQAPFWTRRVSCRVNNKAGQCDPGPSSYRYDGYYITPTSYSQIFYATIVFDRNRKTWGIHTANDWIEQNSRRV